MIKISTQKPFSRKISHFIICAALLLTSQKNWSQCTILSDAVQGISYTYILNDGTNASGVAYNPNFNVYYAVIAGNPAFPLETFDPVGTSLYQTQAGFDFRGLWWNPNTDEVEGNGYYTYGLWTCDLDANGYALNTGTNLFTGQNQPSDQSCGDYDYTADEIIYYYNGSIYRYDRATQAFLGSYTLNNIPVPIGNLNWTSVVYTGCCGNEIGIEDYIDKKILLFNKSNGNYSGACQLPATAPTNDGFRFSYANDLVWLYDANTRTWTSYSILSGSTSSVVDIGNDTSLCAGNSLVLSAGSSSYEYLWSNGSTDSTTTINSAGTYWLQVTNGNCVYSDTIVVTDTVCAMAAFASSDTSVCQKFCVAFYDSSTSDPFAWQWYFPGASPASSIEQNPINICYNDTGTFDVTLITTSATGNDTLTLTDYITVHATPPIPVITQNDYELTASAGSSYQWQLNSVDIPGATSQTYDVLQTGLYTVIVYDENGCKNSASLFVQIVGINELNDDIDVFIHPNPTNGNFTIDFLNAGINGLVQIEVVNSIGQVIYAQRENITSQKWVKEIQLNATRGVYCLNIKTENGFIRKKLLVQD